MKFYILKTVFGFVSIAGIELISLSEWSEIVKIFSQVTILFFTLAIMIRKGKNKNKHE